MPYKKPRGKCPYCGRKRSVNKDGTLRWHVRKSADPRLNNMRCNGTGQRPS